MSHFTIHPYISSFPLILMRQTSVIKKPHQSELLRASLVVPVHGHPMKKARSVTVFRTLSNPWRDMKADTPRVLWTLDLCRQQIYGDVIKLYPLWVEKNISEMMERWSTCRLNYQTVGILNRWFYGVNYSAPIQYIMCKFWLKWGFRCIICHSK